MHPLLLPDLVLFVSEFVEPEDQFNCCLVNKTWYYIFNPLLWREMFINRQEVPRYISDNLDYVRELVCKECISPENLPDQWTNLLRLNFQLRNRSQSSPNLNQIWRKIVRIIHGSPKLTEIRLSCNDTSIPQDIISSMQTARNLYSLRLTSIKINTYQAREFWSICALVENLELIDCSIPAFPVIDTDQSSIQSNCFQNMKEIKFARIKGLSTLQQLSLFKKCLKLRTLSWSASRLPLDMLNRAQSSGTVLSELESVSLNGSTLTTDILNMVQFNKKTLKSLAIGDTYLDFGTLHTIARCHFQSLQELDLKQCTGVGSKSVILLLRSCPMLTSFKAGHLLASEIRRGETWGEQLTTLHINIDLRGCNHEVASKRAFECLSKLTLLRELDLSNHTGSIRRLKYSVEPLLLQLTCGFDQLYTLRKMTRFYFQDTDQRMTMKEARWIKKNWKMLQIIKGQFNSDSEMNIRIERSFHKQNKRYSYRENML